MQITLQWSGHNKNYYREKGYTFTSIGEDFKVSIEDLPPKSSVRVNLLCSVCGTEHSVRVAMFKNRPYVCRSCTLLKKRENIETIRQYFLDRGLVPQIDKFEPSRMYTFLCPQHPDKIQQINLGDLRSGHGCKYCGIERRAQKNKTPIKTILEAFKAKGYTPLFTEVTRITELLDFVCPQHGHQKLSYQRLKSGGSCPKCTAEAYISKNRLSILEVEERFLAAGLLPMFTEYVNNSTLLEFICPRHPQLGTQYITVTSLKSGAGCIYCRSSTRVEYKKSAAKTILKYLRENIRGWVAQHLATQGKSCVFTKCNKSTDVHHIINFRLLVQYAHTASGIERKKYVSEYTQKELYVVEELLRYYQDKYKALGVTLSRPIHKLYHRLFGREASFTDWCAFENQMLEGII